MQLQYYVQTVQMKNTKIHIMCVYLCVCMWCRIGRVFTSETLSELQKETVSDVGEPPDPTHSLLRAGPSHKGGLLWQLAWCPLLQVYTHLLMCAFVL